jgi:DNA adenine methylase
VRILVPPIKSQGIKTKLVPWILGQIPATSGRWIEPFMGTGVVGFNARFRAALMADVNPHLVRFYSEVKNDIITPEIVRDYLEREGEKLSHAADGGYEHYRHIRSRFNAPPPIGGNPLDFVFLNRAGFNGMIRFSKRGWNIPFCKKPDRFKGALITKIVNQVINVRNLITPHWEFAVSDFRETISKATADDIIYCDPPYHGRHADYFTSWAEKDEADLAYLLKNSPAKFILSTWHHNEFRTNMSVDKYWRDFVVLTREHFYHAGAKEANRKPVVEALVMNFVPSSREIEPAQIDEGDAIVTEIPRGEVTQQTFFLQ